MWIKRRAKAIAERGGACLMALALAGCGGIGVLDYSADVAKTVGSALPFQAKAPPPAAIRPGQEFVDECPHVEVLEGTSAMRVGGEANAAVRHQFSLGNVARECSVVNGQLAIKVGVEGRVLIGPAGAPGSFTVPLRIAIRRESDQKPQVSNIYRIAAAVPAGDTQISFAQVSELMLVPYTGPNADADYTVLVGFDTGGAKAERPAARQRRR